MDFASSSCIIKKRDEMSQFLKHYERTRMKTNSSAITRVVDKNIPYLLFRRCHLASPRRAAQLARRGHRAGDRPVGHLYFQQLRRPAAAVCAVLRPGLPLPRGRPYLQARHRVLQQGVVAHGSGPAGRAHHLQPDRVGRRDAVIDRRRRPGGDFGLRLSAGQVAQAPHHGRDLVGRFRRHLRRVGRAGHLGRAAANEGKRKVHPADGGGRDDLVDPGHDRLPAARQAAGLRSRRKRACSLAAPSTTWRKWWVPAIW